MGAHDFDSFTFDGNAGEGVRFRIDESVSSIGQIILYKPDGSYFTYGNNAKTATLPDTGTYTAVVEFTNATQTGDYTVHYVRASDSVENGSLSLGSTYYGYLGTHDFDSFTYTGLAGAVVNFTVSESVSSIGQVILYKPDGSYFTYGNNAKTVTLPDTGTYTVIVEFTNATQSGDYAISVN